MRAAVHSRVRSAAFLTHVAERSLLRDEVQFRKFIRGWNGRLSIDKLKSNLDNSQLPMAT